MLFSAAFKEDETALLHTGRNSHSKEELRADLAEMLADQNPDEEMDYHAQTLETLLTCSDCILIEHEEPFATELEMDCVD